MNNKGFTLTEILVYIAISTVIISAVSSFIITMIQSQAKNRVATEVEQQGLEIQNKITQIIRNSKSITSPTAGNSATTTILETNESSNNPTIFALSGNNLTIKEGNNSVINLNNTNVSVSNLSFSNVSRPNTPGSIKIQFTLNYINNAGSQTYTYSKPFYATATIR